MYYKPFFITVISLFAFNWLYSINSIDNLSNINEYNITYQQANYAKDGSNNDGIITSNFLDTIPKGLVNNPNGVATNGNEFVIANIEGPATLERIWCAAVQNINGKINFYFDGEIIPRLSTTIKDFFYNKTTVFDSVLINDIFDNSGGNILYATLNIKNNLIITTEAPMYAHVGFKQLPKDTVIESWSNTNDVLQSNLLSLSGNYPKSNQTSLNTNSSNLSLNANEVKTIYTKSGAGTIEGVELNIKDLNFNFAERISDTGNVRKGLSRFRMAINGNADSLFLVNLMNKNSLLGGTTSSTVAVFVDNLLVDTWTVTNFRDYHFWEDERFYIPKSFYQGKNNITFTLLYLNGDNWTEFKYTTICDNTVTDELDVKNSQSETAHNYSATGIQNNTIGQYLSTAIARYNSPLAIKQNNHQILDSVYIAIYFDGATTPNIYAPIGLFFGAGTNDAAFMNALLFGNNNNTYYNYFTQPFWTNVKIDLENKSSIKIDSIFNKIMFSNVVLDKNNNGYLNTYFKTENKLATDSTDYNFLATTGKGKMVALVLQGVQDTVEAGPISYLEGDERIYIDDAQTPFIYGTGTEDLFNCGFYFIFDEVCLPLHGMSNSDKNYYRNMYRIFLNDAIYFRKNINANVEHGPTNDRQGAYNSLCFYYWQNDTTYQLTDSIDVGNTSSETAHQYTVYGTSSTINKTSTFEGINDKILLQHNGRKIVDSVEFIVHIKENNNGIRLLRTFDYSIKNQSAKIFVDDVFVGNWLNAGANSIQQFKDDIFAIPASFTNNKTQVKIKVVANNNWSSLYYKIYTLLNNDITTPIKTTLLNNINIQVFPNPTSNVLNINSNDFTIQNITIYQLNGKQIKQITLNNKQIAIAVNDLAKGMYIAEITTTNNKIAIKKFVVE